MAAALNLYAEPLQALMHGSKKPSGAVPGWMVTGQAKIAALTRVVPRESKILETHFGYLRLAVQLIEVD